MGISFASTELETMVRRVLSFCHLHHIEFEFYDIDDSDFYEDKEIIISSNSEITISLPQTEEYHDPLTIEELDCLIDTANSTTIIDEYKLFSPTYSLISIGCDNPKMYNTQLSDFFIEQQWGGKEVLLKFKRGFCCYSLKLTTEKLFDRNFPPVAHEDLFIEITSQQQLSARECDEIIEAFIFECATTLGLNLYLFPRPTTLQYWNDESEGDFPPHDRLRPLIHGKGMYEVLHIYNSCNQIHDPEFLILNYTKVIEYVSQTVLRKEMLDVVTRKLYSPKTLNPDANYILDLEKLFVEQRNNQKDNQAIKLTISTCCDIMDVVSLAPDYLKRIKKLTLSSSRDERANCLEELAAAISDTRNMIAHAKTNYNMKGKECPGEQLHDFAACLKIVSSQTIRWFSRQHEDSRII
ncbi:hypothetical protein [Paenibacillus odorifer]|uniref:ApeA N-terminal domain-containing protein n=1 Tax=Paenibacillus odorifer TaxID=189426 RepID=A0ABX3GK04_9BACL|nr:hypothetical protein [Paenibacillus odorifer]OMD27634.1 hypothetical protein BSO21_19965 [Paenibacillus odorifer]